MEPPERRALGFPCEFPIKALGRAGPGFRDQVVEIVSRHVAGIPDERVTSRPSQGGRYTSVTVRVTASSQGQLDAIYRELSACEQVLMVL